jgi:phosphatidylethanolamine/phosphatidyl-N-methylethanolamine N-methyltransferase
MDNALNLAAYRRLAPVYDLFFGPIFEQGRRRAIQRLACVPGDKVLELGVGTGLALPLYPDGVEVLGVDFSEVMMAKARARIVRLGLKQRSLERQDAMALTLPDAAFDKVLALYITSVVPDPLRLMAEMRRVCKPGGDLLLVNHFSGGSKAARAFERFIAPICPMLGFRPDLELASLLKAAGWEGAVVERVNLLGYWRLIHLKNV